MGSGGKNKAGLAGRGKTLPADERPWHKGYSGTEKLPAKTARKQDKERRAAAAEGRAPKIGKPGTKDTTWGNGTRGKPGAGRAPVAGRAAGTAQRSRGSPPAAGPTRSRRARSCCSGATRCVEALRALVPATALYIAQGIDVDDRINEIVRTAGDRGMPDPGDQPRRAGPDDRRRAAPGRRPAGAAVRVRELRRPGRRRHGADRPAAGRAGRGHRPAQPGRGDPVGGRVRRARCLHDRSGGPPASPPPRGAPVPVRPPGCRSPRSPT